jgi:predicted GH43/DUF377 family glycosyl hydrolase
MLILKASVFIHKYSCFAKRKYRLLKFRIFRKLRKILSIEPLKPFAKGFSLPSVLQNIPFIDAKITNVFVRDIIAPYNASMIKHGQNYLLFFRYDTKVENSERPYHTQIGCVELDKNFKQTNREFVRIDTKSNFSEDPRVLELGDRVLLSYNDFLPNSYIRRSIHLASLHPDTLNSGYITNFHIDKKPVEKNWTLFIHDNVLHFDYYLNPRQILKVPNPEIPNVEFLEKSWEKSPWPQKWGFPRGGTPARKIGNEYLSFFHSAFQDPKGLSWYVMAAYTFEENPPFRITSISPYPILFEGIYNSPILNTAWEYQRAVFPAGFVIDQDQIHISLGENDSAVKILTLDKNSLLKNLKKISQR